PTPDAYYDAMLRTREQFQKITLPILTITGQYDGDELGALTYYRDHFANASPQARAKHFLIIGPWDHAGTRTPKDEVAGVKLGPGAMVDLNDLHRQWYDWTMKSGPKPAFLKNQVAYYCSPPATPAQTANGNTPTALRRWLRIQKPFTSIQEMVMRTEFFARALS